MGEANEVDAIICCASPRMHSANHLLQSPFTTYAVLHACIIATLSFVLAESMELHCEALSRESMKKLV